MVLAMPLVPWPPSTESALPTVLQEPSSVEQLVLLATPPAEHVSALPPTALPAPVD